FSNSTLSGTPAASRTDSTVNYAWRGEGSPAANIPTDNFSSRWTGSIEPRFSEPYTFTTVSDDGVRSWVDGQLLIDHWDPHSAAGSATTATTCTTRLRPVLPSATPSPEPASTSSARPTPTRGRWTSTWTACSSARSTPAAAPGSRNRPYSAPAA